MSKLTIETDTVQALQIDGITAKCAQWLACLQHWEMCLPVLLITRAPDLGVNLPATCMPSERRGFLCCEMHRTYTLPCTTVPAIGYCVKPWRVVLGVLRANGNFWVGEPAWGWEFLPGPPLL